MKFSAFGPFVLVVLTLVLFGATRLEITRRGTVNTTALRDGRCRMR